MRKIHVLFNKEAVVEFRLQQCTVVVVDVFLATSTITTLLANGIEPVYAVENAAIATKLAENLESPLLLFGESEGLALDGFLYPDPTLIHKQLNPTQAIICSTNGTRAIQKAKQAKQLYISSLVNGHAVAKVLHSEEDEGTIVIIAAGNNPTISIEDLTGAGQIVSHLLNLGDYDVTDAAFVSKITFDYMKNQKFAPLKKADTAKLLQQIGIPSSVKFVLNQIEQINVVPIFKNNQIISYREEKVDE